MTRRVTYCRQVSERAWGRLKKWTILRHTLPARHVPNAQKMVLVLAAISNKFFPVLAKDSNKTKEYSKRIKDALQQKKHPLEDLPTKGWHGSNSTANNKLTAIEFLKQSAIIPKYDNTDIVYYAMSTHSMNKSNRYIEHGFDKCTVWTHRNQPDTIQIRNILGRFKSTKTKKPETYTVSIRFDSDKTKALRKCETLCTCKSGKKKSNPCSHGVAALRYIYLIQTDQLQTIKTKFYTLVDSCIIDCHDYVQYRTDQNLTCICNKNDNKWKISCDLCKESYHPRCLGLTLRECKKFVANDDKWWCKFCDEAPSDVDDHQYDLQDPNEAAVNDSDDEGLLVFPVAANQNTTNKNSDEMDDVVVTNDRRAKRRKLNSGGSVNTGVRRPMTRSMTKTKM